MKIEVKVKPRSKKESLEKISDFEVVVRVKESPINGKANKAVIKLLAKYFKVSQRQVQLLVGGSSKTKLFEIIK